MAPSFTFSRRKKYQTANANHNSSNPLRLIRYVVSQSHANAGRERVGFSPRIFSSRNYPVALCAILSITAIDVPYTILRFATRGDSPRRMAGFL